MTLFPKIARPCPYVDRLDTVMDGDFCRMCKRQVHDLTDMDTAARAAFLADCSGQVCVRYTVWMKPAVAAAALAVSAGAVSGLAGSLTQPTARVVGEPVQLAGDIALPPDLRPVAPDPQPKPPRARKPVPLPEIPHVLAGLPAPVEEIPADVEAAAPIQAAD